MNRASPEGMTDQTTSIELGLDTFGDVTVDADGRHNSQAQVLRDVVVEAELADKVGVDFIGLGEHHRPDFAISAPDVVLAAIASRTERIRLGTAVTVLSTDYPVRVYQRFSTLNAISNGRAEVILGRGSFTESFPLFGDSLEDYDDLFEEKVAIFAAMGRGRGGQTGQLEGHRAPADRGDSGAPSGGEPAAQRLGGRGWEPGIGGATARYRFPLTLAIIGGDPGRFVPYVELYHRALAQLGAPKLAVGIHSPGHMAETDAQAREELWPAYQVMRNRIGAERGWAPTSRAEFEHEVEAGSLYVGSPDTVARKIAATVQALGASRFDLKYSAGTLPHELMMKSIELYGREVMPRVRELLT